MSAVAWEPAFTPGRMPGQPRRSHLTVLPGGAAAGGIEVQGRANGGVGGVRLTRWGRLAITLTVLVVALTVGSALMSSATSEPAAAPVSVTVVTGDTLSGIAAREMPGVPVREAVEQIAIANNLPNHHVNAGQVLSIPSR